MIFKNYILIILGLFTINGYNQNIMKVTSGVADINDTLEVHIKISNNQPFIAFQCDVKVPLAFDYISNSAQLYGRENGHSLTVFELSDSVLRFLAYSSNNDFFSGDTGSVMCFKLFSGNQTDIYYLKVQNAIIADSLSQNMLDQSIDGTWYIGPVGLPQFLFSNKVLVYPNPGRQEQIIYFEIQDPANAMVQLFNSNCQLLSTYNLYLPERKNYLRLNDIDKEQNNINPGIYFLNVLLKNDDKETKHFQKLIITE